MLKHLKTENMDKSSSIEETTETSSITSENHVHFKQNFDENPDFELIQLEKYSEHPLKSPSKSLCLKNLKIWTEVALVDVVS